MESNNRTLVATADQINKAFELANGGRYKMISNRKVRDVWCHVYATLVCLYFDEEGKQVENPDWKHKRDLQKEEYWHVHYKFNKQELELNEIENKGYKSMLFDMCEKAEQFCEKLNERGFNVTMWRY